MMFRVGQKVVCISGFGPLKYPDEILPLKGDIYTVGEIIIMPEGIGLRLVEIVNPPHDYCYGRAECCFAHDAFRPIVENETDISFAHEILRDASAKVPA